MSASTVVATVGRARGLRGEVILRGEPDALVLLGPGTTVLLSREGEADRSVELTQVLEVKDGLAVRLEDVSDRTSAESLCGTQVSVRVDELPPPTTTSWAWIQIEGFSVETTDGRALGRAAQRIRTGAHDVIVAIDDADREVLVPASPNVLKEIDAGAKRIVIEAIPGLLELNE